MLQELKKLSIRRILPTVAILLLAAVFCLIWGGTGVIKLMQGPVPLKSLYGSELVGQYVQADVYIVYDWYAETTSRREGSSRTTTESRDYIIDANDAEYIALEVPARDISFMDEQIAKSMDYLDYITDDIDTCYSIQGTVEKMDSETRELYMEYLGVENGSLPEEFLPYIIKQDMVGNGSGGFSIFVIAGGLLMLGFGLFFLIKALRGGYQRQINARALVDGSLPMLDEFYSATEPVYGVRADERYVLFNEGAKSTLLDSPDLVWAYVYRVRHRTNGIPTGTSWSVRLCTRGGKVHTLAVKNEAAAGELITALAAKLPHLVTGYSEKLNALYRQDPARFASIPYDSALQQELFS